MASLEDIITVVCQTYGVEFNEITGLRPTAPLPAARRMTAALAYLYSDCAIDELADTLARKREAIRKHVTQHNKYMQSGTPKDYIARADRAMALLNIHAATPVVDRRVRAARPKIQPTAAKPQFCGSHDDRMRLRCERGSIKYFRLLRLHHPELFQPVA